MRDFLNLNPSHYKQFLAYNSNLRSTSAYWYARSRELLDMVEQLGPPTIFLTLSAAGLLWPELNRLFEMEPNFYNLDENEQKRERAKKLNKFPHIAAYYFQQRAEIFIHHLMIPNLKIVDFWYRIEFQHRGSPHIHGLFWIENAPSIDVTHAQPQAMEQLKNYFDTLISTWHPNPNEQYDAHPSSLHYSQVENHESDYNHLIRAVQTHKCTRSYCLRQRRNSNQFVCRFKFPKDLLLESKIEFVDNVLSYVPKRNAPGLILITLLF